MADPRNSDPTGDTGDTAGTEDTEALEPLDAGRLEAAWPAQPPPLDFAARVLAAVARERRAATPAAAATGPATGAAPGHARPAVQRRVSFPAGPWVALAASLLLVLGSAAIAYRVGRGPLGPAVTLAAGTLLTATERREVRLGDRAVAVLEAGAELAMEPSGLVQRRGNVFYRVTRTGAPFAVRTAAGEVVVQGTCFRVKVREGSMDRREMRIGAAGVALGALVFVGVYEGRVRLGHASGNLALGAGEAATSGRAGWQKSRASLQQAERGFDQEGEAAGDGAGLRQRIRGLRTELKQLEQRRSELETELARRPAPSAGAAESAPGGERPRAGKPGGSEFDLSPSDWAELAKSSTVKYRVPCQRTGGWKPSPEQLEKLGLAPDDAQLLQAAYARSNERVWQKLRPLCIAAVGSAEIADRLGADTCVHSIVDVARKEGSKDGGPSAGDLLRQVGEVRAGSRSAPAADEPAPPVLDMFLTLTSELGRFEADLAQELGPEEAHRLAHADDLCTSDSTWGGRKPAPPARR